jgi:hypothetical protein
MNLHHALALIPLAALSACGSSDGEVFTIGTGTYVLSSVSPVSTDDCNLAVALPNGTPILVTVANGAATISLDPTSNTPERYPVCTITDNTIADGTKSYNVPSDNIPTCTETITVTVGGEILADNQFSGTLKYVSQVTSGSTGCTADDFGYKKLNCASTMTFVAKK